MATFEEFIRTEMKDRPSVRDDVLTIEANKLLVTLAGTKTLGQIEPGVEGQFLRSKGASLPPEFITVTPGSSVWTEGDNIVYYPGDVRAGRQFRGGFGAMSTSGVKDWNDIVNAYPGSGFSLLRATDSLNAPPALVASEFYHPFTFEYGSKGGTGNLTQFAIPYRVGDVPGKYDSLFVRSRYQGDWYNWQRIPIEIDGQIRFGGSSGRLEIATDYGTAFIGPTNASACHMYTSTGLFYMAAPLIVKGDIKPYVDAGYNLGSATTQYKEVFSKYGVEGGTAVHAYNASEIVNAMDNGVNNIVYFASESLDRLGEWHGYYFQPKVTGFYLIKAQVTVDTWDSIYSYVMIYRGAAKVAQTQWMRPFYSGIKSTPISGMFWVDTTQTITIRFRHSAGTRKDLQGGLHLTYFMAARVG